MGKNEKSSRKPKKTKISRDNQSFNKLSEPTDQKQDLYYSLYGVLVDKIHEDINRKIKNFDALFQLDQSLKIIKSLLSNASSSNQTIGAVSLGGFTGTEPLNQGYYLYPNNYTIGLGRTEMLTWVTVPVPR